MFFVPSDHQGPDGKMVPCVLMTPEPDKETYLFFYRKDDVLELHRLIRFHLSAVIKSTVEKLRTESKKSSTKRKGAGDDTGGLTFSLPHLVGGKVNVYSVSIKINPYTSLHRIFSSSGTYLHATLILFERAGPHDVSSRHWRMHSEDNWGRRERWRKPTRVHQGPSEILVWEQEGE